VRITALTFGLLCALYLLSAGGQGYSVDGAFSYRLARDLAARPGIQVLAEQAATLQRWGPVVPALGAPLVWLGERLAAVAPRPDTVPFGGRAVRLYDWPPLAPAGASGSGPDRPDEAGELRFPLPSPIAVRRVDLVSFLSFSASVPDGTPIAEVVFRHGAAISGVLPVRAGRETAEWAYDLPAAPRPHHRRAPLVGHWPGNPQANLYGAQLTPDQPITADQISVRYTGAAGRLHLRALVLDGDGGPMALPGPAMWSDEQQRELFGRFAFSFLNAPLMALACALLVPLARLLGYAPPVAAVFALGVGAGTLAWPYAKLDFSETAATLFAIAATVLTFAGARRLRAFAGAQPSQAPSDPPAGRPRVPFLRGGALAIRRCLAAVPRGRAAYLPLVLAGALVALAAGAKYTAAWFAPLLALQLLLLTIAARGRDTRAACGHRRLTTAAAALAALLLLPGVLFGAALVSGRGPLIWAGWQGVLDRGWLNFPPWHGLYSLLLSPGKSLFLYAPPLVLAVAGAVAFARRHRWSGLLFFAVPAVYLAVFASKGVWHGGGWGPRYLVPALPFLACLALPVVERARATRAVHLRAVLAMLLAGGVMVQLLGVAKHPNLYPIMFRDHILPFLPDYGAPLGGPPALAYWRHFGGPEAGRQLARPAPAVAPDPALPPRGLGYLFAESGPLEVRFHVGEPRAFALTVYTCDFDHRGRRQRVQVVDALGPRSHTQSYNFSPCEYLSWDVAAQPGQPLALRVAATGPDVPVISAVFFDPPAVERRPDARVDRATQGRWLERYGSEGFVLFAWRRGGIDVAHLPQYVTGYDGGDRVWVDTGETELEDTALLYAPAFSPLLAHAWLLACDAIFALFPQDAALQQRALASPPWRYLARLDLHSPHPEYGLGLDLWPVLLHSYLSSHPRFMAAVWATAGALGALALACAWALARTLGQEAP
jgi:hypothetical protein